MKRYMNLSLIYTVLGLLGGVFYREFTKFNGFTGKTVLGVVHTHYLVLGMLFFLFLLVLEKNFSFRGEKTEKLILFYNVGLNLTALVFLVKGIIETLGTVCPPMILGVISGIAGIGHILLGVTLVLIILDVRKSVINEKP